MSPASAAWCRQCYRAFPAAAPVLTRVPATIGPSTAPVAAASLPAGWTARPVPSPYTEDQARRDGRLLDRKAAVLVAAAIGLGGVMQLIAVRIAHVSSVEPEALIRYDIVLTIGMYAVVAAMIVSQITPSVRLRWGNGPLAYHVIVGAGVGVAISLVLLVLVSAAAGHMQSDPRLVLLMSEGDPTHIVVTVLIGCVAAPLVEETLFRGLLLESLLPRGKVLAIVVSAGAFAVWHFMPASLVYYAALGGVLGGLYVTRGLACSLAAHVGFNAVLTVTAILIVLGPSHVVRLGAVDMTAPSGWSVDSTAAAQLPAAAVVLVGPDEAQLDVVPGPAVAGVSADVIAERVRNGDLPLTPDLALQTASPRVVSTPVGGVVEVGFRVDNQQGTLALLTTAGQSYELVFVSAGSERADAGFQQMLASLRAA
jgi:membrane protease YdiL (CAAX protease family)